MSLGIRFLVNIKLKLNFLSGKHIYLRGQLWTLITSQNLSPYKAKYNPIFPDNLNFFYQNRFEVNCCRKTMEKWQKNHLTAHRAKLVEETICNELIFSHLLAQGVLANADVERFVSKQVTANMLFKDAQDAQWQIIILFLEA